MNVAETDTASPIAEKPRWWQWPTVLSLDAPAVVVTWSILLSTVSGIAEQWWHGVVLASSVWLAYVADRWFEARRTALSSLRTPRHRFYRRHAAAVATVWLLVLAGDLAVAFTRLHRREIIAGLLLLAPALAYVLSHQLLHRHHRLRPPKELCVGGLIAGGASVFVFAAPEVDIVPLGAATILFGALCVTNVVLISVWEAEVDAEQGQTSIARQFPGSATVLRWTPFVVAVVAAAAGPALRVPAIVAHCVACSAVLLAVIDHFEPRLGWQRARVFADVALLTPLLPLFAR